MSNPAFQPPKAITNKELSLITIRRVIIHDVPRRDKTIDNQKPVMSDVESPTDPNTLARINEKLTRVLGSSGAYPIEFAESPQSSVPAQIGTILTEPEKLVSASQDIALALLEHQPRSSPAGLLTVIDCTVAGQPAVAILKLEREAGTQLTLSEHNGRKTFEMAVLGNLVLTDGTKLFKAALFVWNGTEIIAVACDDQRSYTWSNEMALFWSRFLGCKVTEAPRVTTRRTFDTTVAFINEKMTNPEDQADLYDSVVSELKSQKKTFSPKKFIEEHVPAKYKDSMRKFYEDHHVPMHQFRVDASEITRHLRKKFYQTETGVRVTVPAESQVVKVKPHQILIDDKVTKVGSVG